MIKAGIIGGSGYTGGELMRLMTGHPGVEVVCVTSRRLDGNPVSDTHPHLRGFTDLKFQNLSAGEVAGQCDVVFTAVPHGSAMDVVPPLLDAGTKVIDLSADYRLPVGVFEKTYNLKHKAPKEAVYGLPELHPEVVGASMIANPGCYPTGAILAAAPLTAAGLVERVVFDSKSGISGAGVEPSGVSHYPNMAENVQAYKLTTHRHGVEMQQELGRLDNNTRVSFTPHVVPSVRGILTTAHLFVKEDMDTGQVADIYNRFYKDKLFIRLIGGIPMLGPVRGSNFCDIGFEMDAEGQRLVVVSAIDNLVKGASGQAVQNMNLMFGLDETAGLWNPATFP
ncbi:MAG: N-acetyl-gamma-glutamyl-phosphate reductase [Methanosarcinales archaeon]|nr:N-acetyl-gamma-glutamyl-phosphate reductase [Methanosarcinales archaeon]